MKRPEKVSRSSRVRSGLALLLGGAIPGLAQVEPSLTPDLTEPPTLTSDLLLSQMPVLPWLSSGSPVIPEWSTAIHSVPLFLRPGLGTSSLGGSALPVIPPPGRNFGPSPPFQLGPVDLRPRLGYQVLYSNGLLSDPGQEEGTWQQTITPGVTLYLGDHWTVDYAPSVRIYSSDGYENSVDQSVMLGWWGTWQDWRFALNHVSAITSDPLVETARQTDQITHSTGLTAGWDRGPRGSFMFSLGQNIRLTDGNDDGTSDGFSWTSDNWYDRPLSPRLSLGVGIGFGYDLLDPGTDMFSERLNARASGRLGDKLDYSLSAGGEFRQFASDASTAVSPLVDFTVGYQVLERTALSLGISHDVSTSYFDDQFTENTSVQAGMIQRLTDRWTFSVSGGYRFTSYRSTSAGTEVEREDNTGFARVAVSGRLLPRLSASLFYSFSGNESDQEDFGFDSHQVGLQLSWTL